MISTQFVRGYFITFSALFNWHNFRASLRTEVTTQRDSDEHRVIVSYPLSIL